MIGVGFLAAFVFGVGLVQDQLTLRLFSKPLPVLCMLLWLVFFVDRSTYRTWLMVGLGFSALGDVLLEIPANLFVAGLIAFLIAHLCYIMAYLSRSKTLHLVRAIPCLLYGCGVFWFLQSYGNLGPMALPVGVYTFVICCMLWRAASLYGTSGVSKALVHAAFFGAALFAMSDTIIAFNKFHAPVPGARYWIIVLYWMGQVGITASARKSAQPE